MTVHDPDLSIKACLEAMDRGRQMVLDDLSAHSTQSAEHYALVAASCVHSTLMPNARQHLLAKLADNPTMAGLSSATPADFANHKSDLEEMRDGLGIERMVWACGIQDIAVGIARAADELFQADGDARGCPGASASEFIFQFVYRMPEHGSSSETQPVTRPISKPTEIPLWAFEAATAHLKGKEAVTHAHVADALQSDPEIADPVERHLTTTQLVEHWLDAKGVLSRAERSRRGSSARLFIDALELKDVLANQLSGIGSDSAERFMRYAINFPLAERGERARIKHIKSFIAFARDARIAVPELDWPNAHN